MNGSIIVFFQINVTYPISFYSLETLNITTLIYDSLYTAFNNSNHIYGNSIIDLNTYFIYSDINSVSNTNNNTALTTTPNNSNSTNTNSGITCINIFGMCWCSGGINGNGNGKLKKCTN